MKRSKPSPTSRKTLKKFNKKISISKTKVEQVQIILDTWETELGLNQNQRIFVAEYLINGYNSTKAYLTAHPEVSYGVAAVEAHRLLKNPKIKQAIGEFIRQAIDTDKLTLEFELIKMFKDIAFNGKFEINKIKAGEQLAKYLKLYEETEKVSIGLSSETIQALNNLLEGVIKKHNDNQV